MKINNLSKAKYKPSKVTVKCMPTVSLQAVIKPQLRYKKTNDFRHSFLHPTITLIENGPIAEMELRHI
jgi:hypothetical protein